MLNGIVLEVVPLFGVNTSAFLLWKKLHNQKSWKIVFKLTLDRFLQFIPILVALMALTIILPLFGNDDPIYSFYTERVSQNCIKHFWTHFFHLTNFINPEAMCTLHTWTFSIDLQFIFLNAVIIWLYQRKLRFGFILNMSLGLFGLIYCIHQTFILEVPPNFLLWPFLGRNLYRNWKSLYISFFSHFWSIMLGTLGVKLIMNRSDENTPKTIKWAIYVLGCCCLTILVNSIGIFNVLRVEQTREINSIFLLVNIALFMVFWSAVLLFVAEEARRVFMPATNSKSKQSIGQIMEENRSSGNIEKTPRYHEIVLILLKIFRQIYFIHGVVYIWYFARVEKPINMSFVHQHLKLLSYATLPSALAFYLCISGPYERFYGQIKGKLFNRVKKD
ncbi:uncharacterized protein LOC141848764 [Brevipalpus obovatus]|uniref:uncharacterized protein LOC141848764 n=1 Tax=Brevipalpus obovatus TaxID=246614 RepID=UPI003D9F1223